MIKNQIETNLKARFSIWLANKIVKWGAPKYSVFLHGVIQYGLASAARDSADSKKSPELWEKYAQQPPTDSSIFRSTGQTKSYGRRPDRNAWRFHMTDQEVKDAWRRAEEEGR